MNTSNYTVQEIMWIEIYDKAIFQITRVAYLVHTAPHASLVGRRSGRTWGHMWRCSDMSTCLGSPCPIDPVHTIHCSRGPANQRSNGKSLKEKHQHIMNNFSTIQFVHQHLSNLLSNMKRKEKTGQTLDTTPNQHCQHLLMI